jgi:hypothetical protein
MRFEEATVPEVTVNDPATLLGGARTALSEAQERAYESKLATGGLQVEDLVRQRQDYTRSGNGDQER